MNRIIDFLSFLQFLPVAQSLEISEDLA